jgi:hypothetical protein
MAAAVDIGLGIAADWSGLGGARRASRLRSIQANTASRSRAERLPGTSLSRCPVAEVTRDRAALRALHGRGLVRVINRTGKHDLAVWVTLAEPAAGLLRRRASGSDLEALSARLQETGQAGGA